MSEKAPSFKGKNSNEGKPEKKKVTVELYEDPIMELRNEGPMDPISHRYSKKATLPLEKYERKVRKSVEARRRDFVMESHVEATIEKARGDRRGIDEMIGFLRSEAIHIHEKGDSPRAKQYVEVIRELRNKSNEIGEKAGIPSSETLASEESAVDTNEIEALVKEPQGNREEQVAAMRAFVNKQTDADLGNVANITLTEHRRRQNTEKDGVLGKEEPGLMGHLSDESLETIAEVLRSEMRERSEASKQKNLEAQVDEDLAIAGEALEHDSETVKESLKKTPIESGPESIEEMLPQDWQRDKDERAAEKRRINPPEETTSEQWEEFAREQLEARTRAESFGWSVEAKKFSEKVADIGKERDEAREEIINSTSHIAPEERAGIIEKIRGVGKAYRNLPMGKKILISASLLTIGGLGVIAGGPAGVFASMAAFTTGRTLSGLGAFAGMDAFLERRMAHNRRAAFGVSALTGVLWAIAVPSVAYHVDQYFNINGHLREWGFGLKKSGSNVLHSLLPKGDRLPIGHNFEYAKNAVGTGIAHLFNNPIRVTEQDRLRGLWGILGQKLSDAGIIDASTSVQKKNYMIDFLEKKLQALGPEGLKQLGFESGNINVIRAGERLDLSILEKQGWIQQIR